MTHLAIAAAWVALVALYHARQEHRRMLEWRELEHQAARRAHIAEADAEAQLERAKIAEASAREATRQLIADRKMREGL